MIIASFAAVDGGVGKTTLCFNFAEYLASEGYNVCLVDKDHQAKTTQLYGITDQSNTVANIYREEGDVDIINIKPHLDIIKGYVHLDEIEDSLVAKSYKENIFFMWLDDNYTDKNFDKYDYMIIDTHSDFRVATKNAITVSHAIVTPVLDSDHDDSANIAYRLEKFKKENIDVRTRKSYVTAQMLRVGSMVDHHTSLAIKFKEKIENDNRYVTYFPRRSVFNKSLSNGKSIMQMYADNDLNRNEIKFMPEYKERMQMLKEAIDATENEED
jgi:chromosome partitioning protein